MSHIDFGYSSRPIENSKGERIFEDEAQLTRFWRWFAESVAVDDEGRPLVVHRGEHGTRDSRAVFQSALGSLAFGSAEASLVYATKPNDRSLGSFAQEPRVIEAYLRIERPAINEPCDPYVDLSDLATFLGRDALKEICSDFSNEIMRTSRWSESFAGFLDPREVADSANARLHELYFVSHALLDSPKWVERIRDAGFDGAIHRGSGVTRDESEYKVFSADQAWIISSQIMDAR